jgi:hypothetical protein
LRPYLPPKRRLTFKCLPPAFTLVSCLAHF